MRVMVLYRCIAGCPIGEVQNVSREPQPSYGARSRKAYEVKFPDPKFDGWYTPEELAQLPLPKQ